jgi:hypothetical protein
MDDPQGIQKDNKQYRALKSSPKHARKSSRTRKKATVCPAGRALRPSPSMPGQSGNIFNRFTEFRLFLLTNSHLPVYIFYCPTCRVSENPAANKQRLAQGVHIRWLKKISSTPTTNCRPRPRRKSEPNPAVFWTAISNIHLKHNAV